MNISIEDKRGLKNKPMHTWSLDFDRFFSSTVGNNGLCINGTRSSGNSYGKKMHLDPFLTTNINQSPKKCR